MKRTGGAIGERARGRARAASVALTVALATAPGARAHAQTAADSAWVAGDVSRAESLYVAQLARADSSPRALHRLALIRAWAGEHDESLALFDRLLAGSPDNLEASLDRARVLSWRNDLDRAADAYLAVLGAHDDSREARLGLARVRAWEGDLGAAEAAYAEILAREPRDVEALAGHARMAAWAGRLDEAAARWRAALEHHPDHPVLLTGLGRALRWQGRSAAALDVLERAVDLAPDDEEALQEYRRARLSIAPRLGPSLTYESDSDGNRMTTLWLDQTVWPARHFAVNASGYARSARVAGSGESGDAFGGLAELRLRVGGEWELDAAAGATHNTLARAGAAPQWRVRIATPGRLPAQAWARVWHRALDETLGAAARALGFDRDLSEGYFDPPFYGLAEVRTAWEARFDDWHVSAEAAPGVQKVGKDPGRVSGSVRTRLSLGREFGPGKIVWLHTGFSSAGLRSFSTAGADYRYYHLALALGWAF